MSARVDMPFRNVHPLVPAAPPAEAATTEAFRPPCGYLPAGGERDHGRQRRGPHRYDGDPRSRRCRSTRRRCLSASIADPRPGTVMQAYRHFGVNILAAEHRDLAERFAGRGGAKGAARYESARWRTLARGARAARVMPTSPIDCAVDELIERHSHGIVIGRVRGVRTRDSASALVYWRGAFDQLGWTLEEIECAIGLKPW